MVGGGPEPHLQQGWAAERLIGKAGVWESRKWEHCVKKEALVRKSLLELTAPLLECHHLETSQRLSDSKQRQGPSLQDERAMEGRGPSRIND